MKWLNADCSTVLFIKLDPFIPLLYVHQSEERIML